ncbi:hypothetical protein WBJ53_13170 [Spirosoma sp. SC4-14]|uniref:hypothetical protein n=1 Tax=Spirosoma sp. SC4-14 TaxID=3128900 RepID=UPI0030CC6493
MKKDESVQREKDWDTDSAFSKSEHFLVDEETDDVDASGVDDTSTGMGKDDYLGKTNVKKKDD